MSDLADASLKVSSRDGSLASMVFVPGGTFRMGSDRHYPEEAPVHRVTVDGFWMDRTPVTNREFKEFVKATGHVTFAEITPDPKDYPGALPHMLYAGSLVFTPPKHPVDLRDWGQWWNFKRRELAPSLWPEEQSSTGSTIIRSCMWRSRRARLRASGPARNCRPKPSGNSPRAAGSTAPSSPGAMSSRPAAGTWPIPGRASFRARTSRSDGFERTSPVTAFPPNGYGVHDMIGNVWEWTTDWYSPKHEADAPKACCIPENPRGGREDSELRPRLPNIKIPRKVIKGGSHLCAPNYCRRYRPAARHAGAGRYVHKPCWLSMRQAKRIDASHAGGDACRMHAKNSRQDIQDS